MMQHQSLPRKDSPPVGVADATTQSALHVEIPVMRRGSWDHVFSDVIIPRIQADHCSAGVTVSPGMANPQPKPMAPLPRLSSLLRSPTIWHATQQAAGELADLVLAGESDTAESLTAAMYLDALVEQGATLEALYAEVFEPAARHLGGLWDGDRRKEIEVTLGLGRLQIEAHRLSTEVGGRLYAIRPGHTVLVAPQPGEPHGLGTAMASELFERNGWDVSCEFPRTDQVLRDLVHDRWFDVLDLSLSAAMRRDHSLRAMAVTIHAARACSLNPALVVLVDGRTFFERPQTSLEVNAHAGCVTVIQAVPTAERLIDALAGPSEDPRGRWHDEHSRDSDHSAAAGMQMLDNRFRPAL